MTAYLKGLLHEVGRKVIWALALMIGLSLLEGIGLLMLLPMLDVLGLTAGPGQSGGVTALVGSLLRAVGLSHSLVAILGAYILVISMHAILVRCHTVLSADLQHSFVQALSQRLYTAVSYTNWGFFSRIRSSELTQLLTSALPRVGQGTYHLLRLVSTSLITVIYIALAVQLSPGMAALASGCAAVLLLVLSTRNRTASETGGAFLQASNRLYTAVTEHLGGMKEAKSYGAEPRHVALWADITNAHRRLILHFVRHSADTKMCFDIGAVVVVSLMFYSAVAIIQVPVARLLLLLFLYARLLPQCAAQHAAADELVATLPQGLDTVLGDRGVRLSGGERQRIALARALLRRPSLLLLDEATSALDMAHEQRIHHALAHLHGELTIVMIAHRLSTVRAADHILVVEAGRVVEAGTWDDLWARPGGRFRALATGDDVSKEHSTRRRA